MACRRVTTTEFCASKLVWLLAANSCLTDDQHLELRAIVQSRSLPAEYVFRRQADPAAGRGRVLRRHQTVIAGHRTDDHLLEVAFSSGRGDGLDIFHPGRTASILIPTLRVRILAAMRKKPSDGSTHWSCRKLPVALRVSKDAVHRVWKEAGLKPHRLQR